MPKKQYIHDHYFLVSPCVVFFGHRLTSYSSRWPAPTSGAIPAARRLRVASQSAGIPGIGPVPESPSRKLHRQASGHETSVSISTVSTHPPPPSTPRAPMRRFGAKRHQEPISERPTRLSGVAASTCGLSALQVKLNRVQYPFGRYIRADMTLALYFTGSCRLVVSKTDTHLRSQMWASAISNITNVVAEVAVCTRLCEWLRLANCL
ncbi:hypothetical protein B0H65DRAFT_111484 [Neurospora tetraspora]|uniref:Uncharacterized protein n=1 Tax=Neurospora tetraspora TaxID=94610 RepID=A0AAE0JL48_9PEZI|nr:hypothetical protein B0H65DRAFT_111484 [Neurospora tetraspora]